MIIDFQENIRILKCKCPELKFAFDPQFRFTDELNSIMVKKKIPIQTIVQSILNFVNKYQANAFGMLYLFFIFLYIS
jgi:hypothetical protein